MKIVVENFCLSRMPVCTITVIISLAFKYILDHNFLSFSPITHRFSLICNKLASGWEIVIALPGCTITVSCGIGTECVMFLFYYYFKSYGFGQKVIIM